MTHSEPGLTPPEFSVDRVAHRVPAVVQSFVCLFVCLLVCVKEDIKRGMLSEPLDTKYLE